MIIAVIAFIIMLLFLVVAHEFGHFILARKAGVTVHEFSIGMGPRLRSFGKDKKGTEFVLRLLPLGGFVRIKGESPEEDGALTQKDSFLRASFLSKVAILLGGVTMNIICAWLIFTVGFWRGIQPIQILPDNVMSTQSQSYLMPSYSFLKDQGLIKGDEYVEPAKVTDVAAEGLGEKIGLQSGDVILGVNNIFVNNMNIQLILQQQIGKNIAISYLRDGVTGTVQTMCPEDSCVLGVRLYSSTNNLQLQEIKFPFVKAMGVAVHEVREQTRLTFAGLGSIVHSLTSGKQRGETMNKLSGPIGAAKIGGLVLQEGGRLQFLLFGGLLSMALAIFNLLPIPALDGGRLLGVIIQRVFSLKEEKYFEIEGWINMVFFIAMLLLGFYVMAHDLVKVRGVKIPGIG